MRRGKTSGATMQRLADATTAEGLKAVRKPPTVKVEWVKHPEREAYTTKTVDPRDGRTYYGGSWLPRAFAVRMGMKSFTVEEGR